MRVGIGDVALFFDVIGAGLTPDGPAMGEKPTLLLLHGGPGLDHTVFRPYFDRFADVAQVVAYDHRGNGRSDRGERSRWNLAQWGDDVVAFCDALGIEAPVVLGLSFGGFVAQSYATRHPDHPAKLILESTSPRLDLVRVLDVFDRLGGERARAAAEAWIGEPGPETFPGYVQHCLPLYNTAAPDPDTLARVRLNLETMVHFESAEYHTMDFRSALYQVRCPTLVVAGLEDPVTPAGDAEDIAAALPAATVRFELFPGAGHAVHRDRPAEYEALLRDFLAS